MEQVNLDDLSAEQKADLLTRLVKQVSTGPTASAPRPRRKRKPETIQYLTEEQWAKLLGVITSPRDRAIFVLAYHRGLRAGEIGLMQMEALRLKDDRLQVDRLKGSASGEYHLCASEVRALKSWLKVRGNEPGALFISRNGSGISQQMLDVLMKRYGDLAGIPVEKRHFHTLKHTCGTHLLARGESIEDVQDHLGHRNIQNTLKYAKFTSPRRQARDKRLRDW